MCGSRSRAGRTRQTRLHKEGGGLYGKAESRSDQPDKAYAISLLREGAAKAARTAAESAV